METFIILGNWTHQGIAKVKDAPARIEAVRKATEAAGGKMVAWYLTFGRYDFVVITEAPDAKAAARLLLANGAQERQHRALADRGGVQEHCRHPALATPLYIVLRAGSPRSPGPPPSRLAVMPPRRGGHRGAQS
jgi:uncharacterized protein with GYD domain